MIRWRPYYSQFQTNLNVGALVLSQTLLDERFIMQVLFCHVKFFTSKTRHIYLTGIKFKIGAENKGWIHTVENNRSIFQLIANWFCQLSWSSVDCLGKGENVTWKSENSNILFHSETFFMRYVREVNPNKAVLLRIFFSGGGSIWPSPPSPSPLPAPNFIFWEELI